MENTGTIIECELCGKKVYKFRSAFIKSIKHYCSTKCLNNDRAQEISKRMTGRKLTEETKEKLRKYTGDKNASWKGGKPKCPVCDKVILHNSKTCLKHKTRKAMTAQHKTKIGNALAGKMPQNNSYEGKFMNIKRGWFDVNGKRMFFRSTWEVNYALYLDFLIKQKQIEKWEYEVDTFWFENIKRGVRSYLPDFKVFNKDGTFEYHEVKGYMDARSATKLKRMAKYHPKIKMVLIGKTEYRELKQKIGRMAGFYE